MPYIITTINDCTTAVATLDEVNAAVRAECERVGGAPRTIWTDPAIYNRSLHGGGTVGPLPDGTVVEVRWIDWMDFERMVVPGTVAAAIPITTFDDDNYRDSLLHAFNAA
jgi:hypothetical protein